MQRKFIYLFFIAIVMSSFSFVSDGKLPRKLRKLKTVSYIPSGQFDGQSIAGFYMFETEVTNLQFREFLASLKRSGERKLYDEYCINNSMWEPVEADKLNVNPMTYAMLDDYPVVNISKNAAEAYCKWLSNHWNTVQDDYVVEFRLPLESEWKYAAQGGHKHAPYPWGGYYMRNNKDCVLAQVAESDKGLGPVEAESYFPNDFGLYNMSGNVSEMLADGDVAIGGNWMSTAADATISSTIPMEQSPFVGFRPVMTYKTR